MAAASRAKTSNPSIWASVCEARSRMKVPRLLVGSIPVSGTWKWVRMASISLSERPAVVSWARSSAVNPVAATRA